jgi:hypothetical protein
VKIKCCEEKLREGTRTNKKWAWREVSFRVKCQGGVSWLSFIGLRKNPFILDFSDYY